MLKVFSLVLILITLSLFFGCRGSADRVDFGKPQYVPPPPQQVPVKEFVADLKFSDMRSNLLTQKQNSISFEQAEGSTETTIKYKFNSESSTSFVLLGINYFTKDSSNLRIDKILLNDGDQDISVDLDFGVALIPFKDYSLTISVQNSAVPLKNQGMNVLAWKGNQKISYPSMEIVCVEKNLIRIDLSHTFYNLQTLKDGVLFLHHNSYCGTPVAGEKGAMSQGMHLNPLDQNSSQLGIIESYLPNKVYGAKVEYFPKSRTVAIKCYEDSSENIVSSVEFNSCYPTIKPHLETY